MKCIDVTDQVTVNWIDYECVEIARCPCGKEYVRLGTFDYAAECRACGRTFYAKIDVRVYEMVEEVVSL